MVHYHGGPFSDPVTAVVVWRGRHAMVSFARPEQIKVAADICQSFCLDNGAFSVWRRKAKPNFPRYYSWLDRWIKHPGCYVIQCFGFGEKNRITSSHIYESGEDLIKGLRPPVRPSAPTIKTREKPPSEMICKAGDLFQVRLGAVTGDANYFLLTEERRQELELPESCLIPVVTRARHLTASSIRKGAWNYIRDSGDRAYLFSPQGDCLLNPSVKAYLRLNHKKGGCDRTAGWVKKRTPWYSVGLPNDLDGFMSGANTNGPWIALNAMEKLAATNTLYVIRFDDEVITRDARAACSLSLLTTYSRSQLAARTRNYAAGMRKLEPSDITGISLPVRADVEGAFDIYQSAVQLFVKGDSKSAVSMADGWFAQR